MSEKEKGYKIRARKKKRKLTYKPFLCGPLERVNKNKSLANILVDSIHI